ncbi:MAG: hypothetical protein M1820_002450 [Bogoriella megaspora]|nr:MAG: hypothetical protein M1820_002450 [Bogoriella megaspora]
MVYSLSYRRPPHVNSSSQSVNGELKAKSVDESIYSQSSGVSNGIPEALSFDKIINGGTCPPCTTRDFMNYLKHIEHAAENLQFFLWYRDYSRRFNELPDSEKRLAPEWTAAQFEEEAANVSSGKLNKRLDKLSTEMFKGSDFAAYPKNVNNEKANPFFTPPRTPNSETQNRESTDAAPGDRSTIASSVPKSYSKKTENAFDEAGLKWQPFTVQPFRDEIARLISIYIADGGARQLNLSDRERATLLHALGNTTHPSAFHNVISTVEWSLRCQAHPNFIRWTICNGNRPRVIFARFLGIAGIVGGLVASLLVTLSSAGRAWRVLPIVGYLIGISTLIAAWKGMCVVLHGMHHRHLRPWELFVDHDDEMADLEGKTVSMESLMSSTPSNSYEDEPWVAKYDKRNIVRKVFDREVWIQEPALRQIQDTIFVQALIGAFIASAILTGIFCAVPYGNFF